MTKPQKKTRLGTRQLARDRQIGHLRRSTIVALFFVALLGLSLSQIHRFGEFSAAAKENAIAWSSKKGFSIQNVAVTGRQKVPSQFIMQALQIKRGMPILSYDPKAAQARLSENPWFKSVHIERRLPDTVFIRVIERIPAARWQVDGKLALVDAEGVAMTTDNLDDYKHLPIIIGQDARHKLVALFALLQAEPEIGREVKVATWIGNRRWDLKMKSGLVVRLPASQPELALSKLAMLNREQAVLKRDVVSIDLRLPEKAVLQPTTRANALIERPYFGDKPETGKKNI